MDNTVVEIIKIIGFCIGYILSAITLVTLICKPIRVRFIKWVRNQNETDETQDRLIKIEQMLQSHIEADVDKQEVLTRLSEATKASLRNDILHLCDICLERGSITSVEKLNLIDMYKEYHNLGGNTYCTDRYELAKGLPEKN